MGPCFSRMYATTSSTVAIFHSLPWRDVAPLGGTAPILPRGPRGCQLPLSRPNSIPPYHVHPGRTKSSSRCARGPKRSWKHPLPVLQRHELFVTPSSGCHALNSPERPPKRCWRGPRRGVRRTTIHEHAYGGRVALSGILAGRILAPLK